MPITRVFQGVRDDVASLPLLLDMQGLFQSLEENGLS